MCPQEESNLYRELRKLAFYPLKYGDDKYAYLSVLPIKIPLAQYNPVSPEDRIS